MIYWYKKGGELIDKIFIYDELYLLQMSNQQQLFDFEMRYYIDAEKEYQSTVSDFLSEESVYCDYSE